MEPPLAYQLDLICEAFGCTPSVAWRELTAGPHGLVWEVIEARAYRNTKARIEAAKSEAETPTGPMADLVMEIAAELWQARAERTPDDAE